MLVISSCSGRFVSTNVSTSALVETKMAGTRTTDHKEGKATVKVVYYTHKTLADGSHPFVVRITKNRKNRWISTGLSLHPKYWNEQKKEIRRSYPETERSKLLKKLAEWQEKYEKVVEMVTDMDEQYDVKSIAAKAVENRKQTRKITLLAYIDSIVEGMVKANQTGNSIVYRDLRNQLHKFIVDEYDTSDVSFDKITVKFCYEWENTLRITGATDNTLSNRFRTLRAVLNRAIANGYAKADNYPFARNVAEKHKFSVGKFDTSTQKRAISRDHIRKIEAYQPVGAATGPYAQLKNDAEIERLQRAKDIFLFSFYVAGINFVDLAKLRWRDIQIDDIENQRINYVRQKTGGKFSLKLLEPAMAIIERYRAETYTGPDSYIFPILNVQTHTTVVKINNRIHKVLGQTNTDLKTIGRTIGLTIPLTTYVARHSFAMALIRAGAGKSVVGQAFQHGAESTTNVYVNSFENSDVDRAMDSLL
ncbi:site-specific integrase [Spirosoma validum]|nr:site-specific integrase [Spirosoma validum]